MESNAILYKDMDYSVILTDTIALHWAVNKQNTSLQEIFNHWLDSIKTTQHYAILLEKYYSPSSKNRRTIGQYQQKYSNNPISFYDDLIKKYAARYNLDWRLVSAVIYRESRFNSQAIGKGGSFGLMQIMPKTAKHLGMSNPNSPENQILYGCKYLKRLKMKYLEKGADTTDIYKFVLAAYNAGSCHIDDAILLAKSKGYNPNSWQDVEKMLIRLSDKKYTKNIPLRCGNYNGKHTKNYVNKVWTSYLHYQNMVD
jgi:membrane-bound lytic murein transglycosylase F